MFSYSTWSYNIHGFSLLTASVAPSKQYGIQFPSLSDPLKPLAHSNKTQNHPFWFCQYHIPSLKIKTIAASVLSSTIQQLYTLQSMNNYYFVYFVYKF